MDTEKEREDDIVIDLKSIFFYCVRRWWIILICLVVGAAAGFGIGSFTKDTVYEATAKYVVVYNDTSSTANIINGSTAVTRMLGNVQEIVEGDKFLNAIKEELNADTEEGADDYITLNQLKSAVSYTTDTDSGTTITISVTTGSADLSYRIICCMAEEYEDESGATTTLFAELIKEFYPNSGTEDLNFSRTNLLTKPTSPVSDNTVRNFTLLGGAGCAAVAIVVLVIIVMADNRVKDEEDLRTRYDAAVLGTIPDLWENKSGKKYGYYSSYAYREDSKND